MAEPLDVRLFLSWAHRDQTLKDDLVRRLTPNLKSLRGLRVTWWEDSHLLLGKDLGAEIAGELDRCDYGVLLLSPCYVTSPFVLKYELPRFVGPAADKGALTVALRPVTMDGSRELHGLEKTMNFHYREKAFSQLGGWRDDFAAELATRILHRVRHDREG